MLGTMINNKETEFHDPVLKQHTISGGGGGTE